jgi:hypothetical protein
MTCFNCPIFGQICGIKGCHECDASATCAAAKLPREKQQTLDLPETYHRNGD